jgi:hypothetical protein
MLDSELELVAGTDAANPGVIRREYECSECEFSARDVDCFDAAASAVQ